MGKLRHHRKHLGILHLPGHGSDTDSSPWSSSKGETEELYQSTHRSWPPFGSVQGVMERKTLTNNRVSFPIPQQGRHFPSPFNACRSLQNNALRDVCGSSYLEQVPLPGTAIFSEPRWGLRGLPVWSAIVDAEGHTSCSRASLGSWESA